MQSDNDTVKKESEFIRDRMQIKNENEERLPHVRVTIERRTVDET
jgi:hypothetical protein